ncbi:MAG: hypothetical protein NWF01_12010 [Candidatus Bathyarchaeota archaeon]|nr:hypothetical protein [Candidatus Bathyarchaeota archaeon]
MLFVNPANTQTELKPSVPEFTAKFTESSLETTIKNQPLTEFEETNGDNPRLYYGFRFKDQAIPYNWNYAPPFFVGISSYGTYYEASASEYTVVSFPFGEYPFESDNNRAGISEGGPIDMQVMALIGIEVPTDLENGQVYYFEGVNINWSNTLTVTSRGSYTASPSPTSTTIQTNIPTATLLTPTIPELSWLAIPALLLSLFAIVLVFRHRKEIT